MTLIFARIVDDHVWMVADTAITGGEIKLREREFTPKVETGTLFPSLVAFAGSFDIGTKAINLAARAATPADAIHILAEASERANVQFAYAWFEGMGPRLLKIESGKCTDLHVLHLGSDYAFEAYQKIRLNARGSPPHCTLMSFMAGGPREIPAKFPEDILAMLELFATRVEHDVGGWVTPYVLMADAAIPCSYCYSISDPVFDKITPGSLIGHGTASSGGYTLSVSISPTNNEMAVYIPQYLGGWHVLRHDEGIGVQKYLGDPSAFKEAIFTATGRRVETWIGQVSPGLLTGLSVYRNQDDRIDAVIGYHGDSYTFVAHNLEAEFSHSGFRQENCIPPLPKGITITPVTAQEVQLSIDDKVCLLNAEDVDRVLMQLASFRSKMEPAVLRQRSAGVALAQFDLMWKAEPALHPAVGGPLVSFRHVGYGWLDFLLPAHEAAALGQWLTENSESKKTS